jgi:hypothetical protein
MMSHQGDLLLFATFLIIIRLAKWKMIMWNRHVGEMGVSQKSF